MGRGLNFTATNMQTGGKCDSMLTELAGIGDIPLLSEEENVRSLSRCQFIH